MPVQYPTGILKEHLHTRAAAGLFDVSHMGQVALRPRSGDARRRRGGARGAGADGRRSASRRGGSATGFFTDDAGGILDDLMVANRGDHLLLVVNAARKADDLAHLEAALGAACEVEPLDRALLALQGPQAAAVLARAAPGRRPACASWTCARIDFGGMPAVVSRSGYTGEDGFEISLRRADAARLRRSGCSRAPDVLPIGLGARNSLRLEAGLCLYGHDIDATTTPVEAALEWAIQPARRRGGARAGGFPGADGHPRPDRRRARRGAGSGSARRAARRCARAPSSSPRRRARRSAAITSGGFGPSLDAPVAMGYVPIGQAAPGTRLLGRLRGKMLPVTVAKMPFIEPGYKRA